MNIVRGVAIALCDFAAVCRFSLLTCLLYMAVQLLENRELPVYGISATSLPHHSPLCPPPVYIQGIWEDFVSVSY